MHLWRFFKKPEINDEKEFDDLPISQKYPLYAITGDKKMAKRFQEERDMNKFIIRKSKVTREEFSEFALQNRQAVLSIQNLLTSNDNNERPGHMNVQVLLTQMEYQICAEPNISITDEYWWNTVNIADPLLFNDNIKESLNNLDYINLFMLFNGNIDYYDEKDYEPPNWNIDQLAYFILIYGNLFK